MNNQKQSDTKFQWRLIALKLLNLFYIIIFSLYFISAKWTILFVLGPF